MNERILIERTERNKDRHGRPVLAMHPRFFRPSLKDKQVGPGIRQQWVYDGDPEALDIGASDGKLRL